jgi:hypothetical protein
MFNALTHTINNCSAVRPAAPVCPSICFIWRAPVRFMPMCVRVRRHVRTCVRVHTHGRVCVPMYDP